MIARVLLAFVAIACFAAGQEPGQLYGRWKVTSVVNSSPITAMSGKAASKLVGQFLILKVHRVQFARQNCRATYEKSVESPDDFLREYKVEFKALRLPEPVTRFDGGCTDIFVRKPNEIIFTWKGYFLEASKSPER